MSSLAICEPQVTTIPIGITCLVDSYPQEIHEASSTDEGGLLVFKNQNSISWTHEDAQYLQHPITEQTWTTLGHVPWKRLSHQEILSQSNLLAMMYQRYPALHRIPKSIALDFEPGRVRHEEFFKIIYGSSAKEVSKQLKTINWFGKKLKIHQKAYASLQKIKTELARLPHKFHRFFLQSSGTYYWRYIKGTRRLSMHSFGIAIDIAVKYSHYWKWTRKSHKLKETELIPYQNKFPQEIVNIFEKNQWIWGGRWYHHDTMHFEYRPELFHPRCVDHLSGL